MAINVSAATKTGVVVLAVWGFMLSSDISRHGASWLHLGNIGQSAASADSYGLTMSDNAVKPAVEDECGPHRGGPATAGRRYAAERRCPLPGRVGGHPVPPRSGRLSEIAVLSGGMPDAR